VTVPQPGPDPRTYIDVNNPLLARSPSRLEASTVTYPGTGTLAVVTTRTPTTTLTVMLTRTELLTWIKVLQDQADGMSSTSLITASPGQSAWPGANGRLKA
jgi:hypothetical protein